MKTTLLGYIQIISLLLISISIAQAKTAQIPVSIAGISLGSDVTSYPAIIDSNFMKEVVVTDWHGFRKGTISYGMCLNIDKILKIDMKYEDKSKKFYNTILKKIKAQYGDPDTWSGDSFGLKHIWKWDFRDRDNNRVTLKLQYNSKDSSETIGNMIKLSYPDKIADERRCFMEMCSETRNQLDVAQLEELEKSDWSHLIPEPQK